MMRILLVVAVVVAVCWASHNTNNTPPPAPITKYNRDRSILLVMKDQWEKLFNGDYNTRQYAVLAFGFPQGDCSLLEYEKECEGICCITGVANDIEEPERHSEYQLINNPKGLTKMLKQPCPSKVYLYTYNAPCNNCHNQILTSLKDKLSTKCPYAKVVVGYSCMKKKNNYGKPLNHSHLNNVEDYDLHCVGKCTYWDDNGNRDDENQCDLLPWSTKLG